MNKNDCIEILKEHLKIHTLYTIIEPKEHHENTSKTFMEMLNRLKEESLKTLNKIENIKCEGCKCKT